MARVSICCSVLNQSELLKGMIENIRQQKFEDWELVLVDDGSTEDIAALVLEFKDPRIKLHQFTGNKGVPHGINWALQHAEGEFVQPLSTDERLDPEKFQWQIAYLDDNPHIDGMWGLPQNGIMGERPEFEQYALRAHNRSREAWIRTLLNLENIPIGGASMLWRRTVLDSIGVFDPQFFTTSDLEWFVRFFKKHTGVVMPFRWAYGVDNPKALSKNVTPEAFAADLAKVREKHKVELPRTDGRITIAIPVRNMEKWVGAAMRSVLAQSFKDVDLMVLDDASTDGTLAEIQKFSDDPRVKVFQVKDENIGPNAAQNQMLAACTTDFFMVLAADDVIEPTCIERLVGEFKKDPWLEFAATQTDFIDETGEPYKGEHGFKQILKASQKPRNVWLQQLYYGNQYFGVGLYRTETLKALGGWDTTVGVLGDYDMYLKLLQRENIFVIEENLTHTRIHGENRSLLKPDQAKLLPEQYALIRSRYYPPRMKVIFATPFYEMRGYSPYIYSMFYTASLLARLGIDCDFWSLDGDSYVDRAKNTIFNKFLEDPNATDLFLIDADMQWPPDVVAKMLMLPEEVVVGSYPQKNSWGKFTSLPELREEEGKVFPVGRMLEDGSALIKAAFMAGGFVRIKRAVLQKFKDHFSQERLRPDIAELMTELETAVTVGLKGNGVIEKTINTLKTLGTEDALTYQDISADPNSPNRVYTEFFTCARKDGLRWGEDRMFGKRLKELGIDVYIYPNINFGHFGVKGWTGNYDQFLRGKYAPTATDTANVERVSG